MYSYVRLSIDRLYSYVRLSIDRCTAYVRLTSIDVHYYSSRS